MLGRRELRSHTLTAGPQSSIPILDDLNLCLFQYCWNESLRKVVTEMCQSDYLAVLQGIPSKTNSAKGTVGIVQPCQLENLFWKQIYAIRPEAQKGQQDVGAQAGKECSAPRHLLEADVQRENDLGTPRV